MTIPRIAFVTMLFSLVLLAKADEPLWTDEERAANSDAVLIGQVSKIERVASLDENQDLYRATVTIESVSKGDRHVGQEKEAISLYYEGPKDGQVSKRCPAYVSLKAEQRSRFYVRLRKIGAEVRAMIDMGSDVQEPPAKAAQ